MSSVTTVLLVDDHALVRDTLGRTLRDESDIRVVGTAGTAEQAVAEAGRLAPDIVLMDIDMPGVVSFDAASTIQSENPDTRVVFLSAFFNDRYIQQALAVRAWGYLVKNEPVAKIVDAIRRVKAGETYFSPEVQERLVMDGRFPTLAAPPATRVSRLTGRELELLKYLARGMGQKEIAYLLGLSINTVHRHVTSVMGKLDIHDRVELARFAIREGLAEA
jgi:DNA-binding NarL/FixJ family response regulator